MSKHITREVWAAAGDFYKAAQPGDTVDEQIVNDFRDCVPPASMSSGYLQVGEAYDHVYDVRLQGWRLGLLRVLLPRRNRSPPAHLNTCIGE